MMKRPSRPDAASLRREAERQLSSTAPAGRSRPSSPAELLHELQVHEIELEQQNEELRRTQLELEQARDQYLDLYDFAPVGYFTVDAAGRLSGINLTGAALLGTDREALRGRPFSRWILPEQQGRWAAFLARTDEPGRPAVLELMVRPVGRDPYPAQITGARLPAAPGTGPSLRCTLQDITERHRSQAEREARLAEQEALNERLRRTQQQLLQAGKMAAIGQLAAGVAHEVNNPLSYVKSSVSEAAERSALVLELLRAAVAAAGGCSADCPALRRVREAQDLDALQRDLAEAFGESGQGLERVTRILKDLRDFAHPDPGQRREASLRELLDHALRVVGSIMTGKVRVERAYAPEEVRLWCQPEQLEQVFVNLLANASQAIAVSGVITLRTGSSGPDAWVEVADTGTGIPKEHLPRLFEPFFTTKPVDAGTGLGLSIAHGIVVAHGGRIEVRSEVGVGTTVRVQLPLTARQGGADRAAAGPGRYQG